MRNIFGKKKKSLTEGSDQASSSVPASKPPNSSATKSTQAKLDTIVDPSSTSPTIDQTNQQNSKVASVNIVFVHGLGGSAVGTWTDDETKFFWPAALTKSAGLENARIMTYGYNAEW